MKRLAFSILILLFLGLDACGVEDRAYDRTQSEEGDGSDGSAEGSESECETNQFLTADCVESESSNSAALTTENSENSEESNPEENPEE
ncbi:MAG: hypothetical protein A3G32_09720 [Deltaproteobacteria bacterium RIFCSPLOWO2_12_FULL_40_28]|nr:MAG: hypothetical protein A3C45_04155 [Deltaproteobacteria bacterium RIFCSPHIGHO2_02_FULL_40_28]OGQ21066.1 MAG: hypothetical protein A3E27_00060 [Deltaproteobacteria bacterium RIFCSPHIGHO2_12_FULL_40_32]OGQ38978.1 MAG: hypothetical protein A3I69_07590 [Deltaproteobacteria bacterium RIFCSPLOWO2_02_FULL_40_36]OGQ53032.1 MAG: hypothetical protein A3G32_09720 [Deltaproteobacteria bacterium RIFCSPLOWO2_12_FULL_40_28]